MTKPVVLGEEAERELAAAVEWYQARAGLGADVLRAVRAVAARIASAQHRSRCFRVCLLSCACAAA